MYPSLFRPLFFRLDPEQAHGLTLQMIRLAGILPPVRAAVTAWFRGPQKPVQAFGLTFPNPVGLAAGYDKDGLGWRGLACLGFGHVEVGTVTWRPQPGNPKPRVFRLVQQAGVINRMGFPGRGAEFVAQNLEGKHPPGLVLGVNLGKNKDTPLENAAEDYAPLMRRFSPLADFLVINISSPNTVGLRRLQGRQALESLLSVLAQERAGLETRFGKKTPVLIKLAPDLSDEELDDALDVILSTRMDGVVATNTTIGRTGVPTRWADEAGGLSGAPLTQLSTAMIRKICQRTGGSLPVVGVGGVMTPQDAQEKLDAGAVLVQVYTGLIYAGPGQVKAILKNLR